MIIRSLIFGAAAGLLMTTASQAEDALVLGTEGAYPPFNLIDDNGNVAGFDIEIGNALCAEMNRKCEWVAQDWDSIIPALLAKKYDAIVASMSITEDRQRVISFTRPYYQTPARFIAKAGAFSDDKPETLAGKRIGVQRATIHATYLEEYYPDSEAVFYATQDEANLDLTSGRVDAVMADSVALLDGFLQTDAGQGYDFFGETHYDRKHHGDGVGIGVRKEDSALRDEFSAAIEAIHANGTYKKINDKYFDFDVWVD